MGSKYSFPQNFISSSLKISYISSLMITGVVVRVKESSLWSCPMAQFCTVSVVSDGQCDLFRWWREGELRVRFVRSSNVSRERGTSGGCSRGPTLRFVFSGMA